MLGKKTSGVVAPLPVILDVQGVRLRLRTKVRLARLPFSHPWVQKIVEGGGFEWKRTLAA